jgi:hypothetical protein
MGAARAKGLQLHIRTGTGPARSRDCLAIEKPGSMDYSRSITSKLYEHFQYARLVRGPSSKGLQAQRTSFA